MKGVVTWNQVFYRKRKVFARFAENESRPDIGKRVPRSISRRSVRSMGISGLFSGEMPSCSRNGRRCLFMRIR